MALACLSTFPEADVALVKSRYVCQVLLNKSAFYFKQLNDQGLVTEREAGESLDEIEENINGLMKFRKAAHTGEMSATAKRARLTMMPEAMLQTLGEGYDMNSFKQSNTTTIKEDEELSLTAGDISGLNVTYVD